MKTIIEYAHEVQYGNKPTYTGKEKGKYEIIFTYLTVDSDGNTLEKIIENRYWARNLFDLKCIVSEQLIMRLFPINTELIYDISDWNVHYLTRKKIVENKKYSNDYISYFARKSHHDWEIDETGTKRIGHYTRMDIEVIK